jgi:hypothetical protein
MLRDNLELNSGLVKFQSRENATAYLETLLQYYRTRLDEYGQQLAGHLRGADEPSAVKPSVKDAKKDKGAAQPSAKGWARVGSWLVNSSDAKGAYAQLTLRIVDDYKARVEKIAEALKSFKDVDSLSQPGTRSYTLFIFKGVPEAVVVEGLSRKVEAFAFSASFRAV